MDLTRRVDGILFDKDGTLFDFGRSWGQWASVFLDRMAQGNAALADRLSEALAFDRTRGVFDKRSVVIAGTPEDVAAAVGPVIGVPPETLVSVINASASQAPMDPAVPLAPFLSGLRAEGIKLGVATNDGEAPARAHLDAAGVTGSFDFIAGSDSGWTPKPAPDMCLAFAEAMGLAPDRCVMVGDSLHDLHAGRAAGMRVVGVTTGIAEADDLAPHADVVLPDIGHLTAWLAQDQ